MSNLTYGQLVSKQFDQVDLFDDFTAGTGLWSVRSTEREYFSITDETYTLRRMATSFFSVSMPKEFKEYASFDVTVKLMVRPDKENSQTSGGVIVMGQRTGTGALAVELNASQQFRVLMLRNGAMHPLFPESNDGWKYSRAIKKNKSNLVEIKSDYGNFDVFINGEYQQSFMNDEYTSGAIGFYVNANSTMDVDFIKISVEQEAVVSHDPEKIDPADVKDETYSELILIFKTKIDAQQVKINDLQRELSVCKSSLNIDTTARKQNNQLRKENRDLQNRVQQVETELTRAQTRLEYLESMKNDIEKSQNGDLILGLTELLSKEKTKNKELTRKVAELEEEIESLKN